LISCVSPCVTLMKSSRISLFQAIDIRLKNINNGDPKGTRTPVPGVRGRVRDIMKHIYVVIMGSYLL
jgi:hypothetical protein